MVENALVLEKEIRALVEKYNSLKEENLCLKTQLEQKTSELELFIEEQEVLKKENDELRFNVKSVEGVESEYRCLLSSIKSIISTAGLSEPVIENNNSNDDISNDENTSISEERCESENCTEAVSTDNTNENNSQFECNNSDIQRPNKIEEDKKIDEDEKVEIRQSQDSDIIAINENEDPFSKASDSDWDNEITESNDKNTTTNNNSEVVSSHDDEYIFSDDDDEDFFFGEEDEKSV